MLSAWENVDRGQRHMCRARAHRGHRAALRRGRNLQLELRNLEERRVRTRLVRTPSRWRASAACHTCIVAVSPFTTCLESDCAGARGRAQRRVRNTPLAESEQPSGVCLQVTALDAQLEADALVRDVAAHLHLAVAEMAVLALERHEDDLQQPAEGRSTGVTRRTGAATCARARASLKNGMRVINIVVVPCAQIRRASGCAVRSQPRCAQRKRAAGRRTHSSCSSRTGSPGAAARRWG